MSNENTFRNNIKKKVKNIKTEISKLKLEESVININSSVSLFEYEKIGPEI